MPNELQQMGLRWNFAPIEVYGIAPFSVPRGGGPPSAVYLELK